MENKSSKETKISVLLHYLEQIIKKRVEICHSINVYDKNIVERYYNTLKLINEVIPLLVFLGKITGFSDIRYQTISDKVAHTINICSCRYFNFSEDNDVYKNGLNLIEHANAIAHSKYVKDLCEENLNICLSHIPKNVSHLNAEV